MKQYQINFVVALMLGLTGLLIRVFSADYILASIMFGLAIVEYTIAIMNYRKQKA